ncbi:hypothetical protein BX616_001065 [Lobosporangium transversale]|uniref:Uncharacterized protein n=1 Tax=Lobosporangium transversale TaxID=64571 RepID=A0A1Y2G7E1_9FUNG|nr:hypothetical protein BCR41DRAFT_363721 [Lobosporangium transversale]KAF9905228.1 hypothetical protein BX616_001065 [Lobosporangium transversale]ORY99777.1 hypothetical protein BCR41DRAFT_363721 [Lobosporangium transversale]|eukprot:XP_021876011.1 hypothetical protein BCR41DRAFT_363721 [Lobosporangium transversale]
MELDEAPSPAPTSRLDHLAELATSPSRSSPSTASSSNSSTRHSSYNHSQPSQEDSRHQHHHNSRPSNRSTSPPSSSAYMKDTRATSPAAHHHSNNGNSSRPHIVQQHLEAEPANWGRSPITPTTARKFNRMAIHEVLEGPGRNQGHPEDGHSSPPYKRKGSPDDASFSDPPSSSRARASGSRSHYNDHLASHPRSPRPRQESPMPQSNSDEDDEPGVRINKKRKVLNAFSSSLQHKASSTSPPSSSGPPEVMDQVRTTLWMKQQQKALIEARQSNASTSSIHSSKSKDPPSSTSSNASNSSSSSNSSSNNNNNSNTNQAITEKTSSGISVFHGSATFAAALNRRPLTSPRSSKNAKSLTIFAPSYSDSSLSIHSAPLQPSQSHLALGMNPRTSQPIRNHTPHPLSQHQAPPTGTIPQPLRSPKTAGHLKKSSRVTLRPGPHTAGLDSSSGTLPAPILSSHTGPLPSPMFPHPTTPFHPGSSLAGPPGHISKPVFMETVSNLFDSMDSTRSLKHTLEEQIRKSAQLLQTLQSSGTMIESLVRGQFKELEKGVIEKFENELEYLSTRVGLLEDHLGLTPPAKKARVVVAPSTSTATTGSGSSSKSSAMTGVTSTSGSLPSPPSGNGDSKTGESGSHDSDLKDGTLPTPPLNKNQDSAMEVEDEEPTTTSSAVASGSSSPRDQATEYRSTVKKLRERVANIEKRQEATA